MAKAVTVILTLISCLDRYERYLEIAEPKAELSENWSRANLPLGISAIARLLHMPRARGQPRRGAAWYAFDSRRKRQKKFEKALALASTRRTRKPGRPGTPPMAYVEEITPMSPLRTIQNISSLRSQITGIPTPILATMPSLRLQKSHTTIEKITR
jgi:hypothetical protein